MDLLFVLSFLISVAFVILALGIGLAAIGRRFTGAIESRKRLKYRKLPDPVIKHAL